MKQNNMWFKTHMQFSIIMLIIVWIFLGIMTFAVEALDVFTFILVAIALLSWPISMAITSKQHQRERGNDKILLSSSRYLIVFSVIVFVVLSLALFAYDYFSDKAISWAYYPASGISLWPIGMLIYNLLLKRNIAHENLQ